MPIWRRYVALMLQWLAIVSAALLAAPAAAAPTHIAASLVAESAGTPGGTVWLAFDMRPEQGWHGYWINPGDAGLPLTPTWTLPPGASTGELRYPVPHGLLLSGLMNHVFESAYAVLVPLTLPASAVQGSRLPLSVKLDWLACTDKLCVPESAALQTAITIAAPGAAPAHDARFDAWRAALPAPLGAKASFALAGDTVRLGLPIPHGLALQDPHLFAAEDRVLDYAAPQAFFRKGDLLIVELKRARALPRQPATLSGVLRLNAAGDGVSFTADPGSVATGGERLQPAGTGLTRSLPLLLLAALAGGLLLNVMPCVFPILSLKALSLARAGESEADARAEGVAYAAGVVTACAALGALLLGLRAGGAEVGWAFQLQEPGVVAALALLAVAITANLVGLYEFAVPGFATAGSQKGAFATGLLAAFVATPCTGPFMAAAMGAALLLPVPQAMLLFVALGLGIALPFLAVAFVPALRRRLPKPGAWMERFRHWMALPMGLTALALFWLASRLGGWTYVAGCAVLAVSLVALLLHAGRLQRKGLGAARPLLAGLAGLAVVAVILLPQTMSRPAAEAQGVLPAKPFSEPALAAARAAGKPVFVYFTADWCLTCKVNEQVAIEREVTRDAFAKAGVTVLRGDWTRRDPAITRYLTAQGAAGVPLYMWYPAGGGAPQQLPQVLGPDALAELARR
ncbi:MAG: thioredoxin family protein [Sphingomonadales bacterium]|nr:thioredoxin family protein [Sphingomonadales bacterium]